MKATKRTRMQSFEAMGPISAMIANELRGKGRGAKVRFFNECVFAKCGLKYPKHAKRYIALRAATQILKTA